MKTYTAAPLAAAKPTDAEHARAAGGAGDARARPDAAKRSGRKGGRKTADGYKDGARVWATRMALARWHKIPFQYEPNE